jgi:hypothetical protein
MAKQALLLSFCAGSLATLLVRALLDKRRKEIDRENGMRIAVSVTSRRGRVRMLMQLKRGGVNRFKPYCASLLGSSLAIQTQVLCVAFDVSILSVSTTHHSFLFDLSIIHSPHMQPAPRSMATTYPSFTAAKTP